MSENIVRVIKVGGSCLADQSQAIARSISRLEGKVIVVIGYGPKLRGLLKTSGIERKSFTSLSGVPSNFTDERVVGASYLAASIEMAQLVDNLRALDNAAKGVMGNRGMLRGTRKERIRFRDGDILRVTTDDLSASKIMVNKDMVDQLLGANECLVVAPLLSDDQTQGTLVCDADAAAIEIGTALKVADITIVSDVEGLKVDNSILDEVNVKQIDDYLPHAYGGMKKKLVHIRRALQSGVKKVNLGTFRILCNGGSVATGTTFYAD